MKYTSEYITTNKITLHVKKAGDPSHPAIILLHGFPEFWIGWREQIDALVEAGNFVIIPDQRGYNLSQKPWGIGNYGIHRLAKDIIGLLDHYNCESAFLAAHDWGGLVAWQLAISYPERIKKLVIANAPHPNAMRRTLFTNFKQLKMSWYVFFFQIPFLPELFLKKNDCENLVKSLQKTSRRGTFSDEIIEEYKQAWNQPKAVPRMLRWYRAAFLQLLIPRKATVSVPTKIIWGKKDLALSTKLAEKSKNYCTDVELTYFEDATHWILHEFPDKVSKELIEFFEN